VITSSMLKLALGAAVMSALTGCITVQAGDAYPGMGNATASNFAVHIVDPNPPVAENTLIDQNGDRTALAFERYRTGTVIKPERLVTPGAIGGGGGGSGSGK